MEMYYWHVWAGDVYCLAATRSRLKGSLFYGDWPHSAPHDDLLSLSEMKTKAFLPRNSFHRESYEIYQLQLKHSQSQRDGVKSVSKQSVCIAFVHVNLKEM